MLRRLSLWFLSIVGLAKNQVKTIFINSFKLLKLFQPVLVSSFLGHTVFIPVIDVCRK